MQGDLISMPLYGVSMAVLAEHLKHELPAHKQVWHANDFSVTSSRRATRPLMHKIGEIGLSRGVFQEPEKSQYVRPEWVPEVAAKLATTCTTMNHKAGDRSLGVYVVSPQGCYSWIKAQVSDWAHVVRALGKIGGRFL